MRQPLSCGFLILRGQPIDSFLLMKHPRRWDLPKGHLDEGETELQCALRELRRRLAAGARSAYRPLSLPDSDAPIAKTIPAAPPAQLTARARAGAAQRIDAGGLHVLPGCIDTQVHFREPGLEHKEDLATGTAGAAMGGIVAVFEMPNTKPSTLTAAELADKVTRAQGRAWTDHAFFMGAAAENADRLGELEKVPGCSGVKIFMGSSTGSLLVDDDESLYVAQFASNRTYPIKLERV